MAARRIATLVVAGCALVSLSPASASAVPPAPPLVTNGDFENASLFPWTAFAGVVTLAGPANWTAASGNQSVELVSYGSM